MLAPLKTEAERIARGRLSAEPWNLKCDNALPFALPPIPSMDELRLHVTVTGCSHATL
jgi:hypothetical protein